MQDTYLIRRNIGAHLPFSRRFAPSVSQAIDQGMHTMQVFMGNPKSFRRQRISDEDIENVRALTTRFPLSIFTHFPYTANFAGKSAKDGLAWTGNQAVDCCMMNMLSELSYELSIVALIGRGTVIHPGSFPDRQLGHKTVAESINKIDFTEGSMLLLENCAGEGNKLCRTFSEIRSVLDGLETGKRPHVGVCVDTAHIWGQGDYDLRKIADVGRMFEDFQKEVGMEHFKLLHLNDSSVELGSKKDRHAHIGTGYIWGECTGSLVYLLDLCEEHEIPIVLETGGPCMLTIAALD